MTKLLFFVLSFLFIPGDCCAPNDNPSDTTLYPQLDAAGNTYDWKIYHGSSSRFRSELPPTKPYTTSTFKPSNPNAFPRPGDSSCGLTKYYKTGKRFPFDGRIVGGQEARPNEFPWLVRLTDYYGETFCSATIIDKNWLLTAAHCLIDVTINANFADHDATRKDRGEFKMTIKRAVEHEFYDPLTYDYDFALLKLPRPLTFSENVTKICLPRSCYDGCSDPGQPAFIHGWGVLHENGPEPDRLQKATVFIKDTFGCQGAYNFSLTRNMVCAGVSGGGIDSCQGDSGGPLVINEDGFYKLCGVVSFGEGCARADWPGIYARVCRVTEWIKRTIRNG